MLERLKNRNKPKLQVDNKSIVKQRFFFLVPQVVLVFKQPITYKYWGPVINTVWNTVGKKV